MRGIAMTTEIIRPCDMEYLEIKNRPYHSIRVGLGVIMVLVAVSWVIMYFEDGKVFHLFISLAFIFTGVYHMTDGFGIEKSWMRSENNILTIKWMDRIMVKRLPDSQIESICLGRYSILFNIRGGKPYKIRLGYMGMKEKTEVYDFLMAYSKDNGLVIFRNPDQKK
jgi:hypothetical protein